MNQTDIEFWQRRYMSAAHGMQTGVAYELEKDASSGTPKHLRVGVNSAMVETSALVTLLIEKRVISELEWYRTLAEGMEAERDNYAKRLSERFGLAITLG